KVQVVEPPIIQNGMSLDPSKPNPEKTRWWTDNTGAFKVEAELISCTQGKVRLFKTNGVKIEVPTNKMCDDDLMYIEHETGQRVIKDSTPLPQSSRKFNWFNYFKRLNMPHEASAAYSQAFERENLNEPDLENLTYTKLKSLGMAENHVRRLQRFVETHQAEPSSDSESNRPQLRKIKKKVTFGSVDYIRDGAFIEVSDSEEAENGEHSTQWQIEQDEKLARMLQEEEDQHSKAAPSIGLQRRDTARPSHYSSEILQPTPVHSQRPAATTTPLASTSGFVDDAWNPRPGPSSIPPLLPQRPRSTQALNTINSHLSNTRNNPTSANIIHSSNQNISPYHQNYTQPNQNIYSYQQTHVQPNQNIASYQQAHIRPNHSGASLHHTPPLHYTNFSPVPSAPTQPLQPAFGSFHAPLQPQMTA
ncbi:cytoskeletal protein binding protein, partial [Rhizopus stolonifer]